MRPLRNMHYLHTDAKRGKQTSTLWTLAVPAQAQELKMCSKHRSGLVRFSHFIPWRIKLRQKYLLSKTFALLPLDYEVTN